MHPRHSILPVFAIVMAGCGDRSVPVAIDEVPQNVVVAVQTMLPGFISGVASVETEADHQEYTFRGTVQGRKAKIEVELGPDGTIEVEECRQVVDQATLPAEVATAAQRAESGAEIVEAEKLVKKGAVSWRLVIKTAGGTKTLSITTDGSAEHEDE